MRPLLALLLLMAGPISLRAETCPKSCGEVCGTQKSCCPAKTERCRSVELERGGDPSSAYASKGGLRLR